MLWRANGRWQSGQIPVSLVKSWLIRSTKHLTNAPFPPLRYLNNCVLHCEQKISTVLVGPFLFGFAINPFIISKSACYHAMTRDPKPSQLMKIVK